VAFDAPSISWGPVQLSLSILFRKLDDCSEDDREEFVVWPLRHAISDLEWSEVTKPLTCDTLHASPP
jgi:hypothetical protein